MGKPCAPIKGRKKNHLILSQHGVRTVSYTHLYDAESMVGYMNAAVGVTPDRPILIDRFLGHATECEADAISDGTHAFVPAVMEHIELAGVPVSYTHLDVYKRQTYMFSQDTKTTKTKSACKIRS